MLPLGLQNRFEGGHYPGKRGTCCCSKIASLGKQPSGPLLKFSKEGLVSEQDERGWFVSLVLSPSLMSGEQ